MLRPVVEDNKNQTIFDTGDGKLPFPHWRIKTLKKKEIQNKKDEGNFYKIITDENSQQGNLSMMKQGYRSIEKLNKPALFGDAAENNYETGQTHPDRPQNQLWRPVEKSISDGNAKFNKHISQNLEKVNEIDIKLQQTPTGFEIDRDVDLINRDDREPSKYRMAPKTKKIVYKSKDLFEREQNLAPFDGISRVQTKDETLTLEPVVQTTDFKYNDGNTFRIDPKVEVYRRKRMEYKLKQEEKRQQDKIHAVEGLKMKLNQ